MSASLIPNVLRTLVFGVVLAAAWIIFGAASAQASGILPPLTDTVQEITGTNAAPLPVTDVPVDTSGNGRVQGPAAALLAPVDTITGPLAPQVHQIIDPVLTPVDAALAPIAAPVTALISDVTHAAEPVTALAGDALNPVTAPVAELTAPVTGAIAAVAAPVAELTAPVANLTIDVSAPVTATAGFVVATTTALNSGDLNQSALASEPAVPAVPATMTDAFTDAKQSTEAAIASPSLSSSSTDAASGNRPLFKNGAFSGLENGSAIRVQSPAPELPSAPADSPATTPTGTGSSLRAGNDAGPTVAAELAAFQFYLGSISLKDALRTSEELPGSVNLEQGFSPD